MAPAAAADTIPAVPTRRDPIRMLNRTGSGYTNNASRALRSGPYVEPEAVPADYQEQLTARAHRQQAQARTLTRADLANQPLHIRIANCQAQAKALKLDVWPEVRLIRLALVNGRSLAHVARRIDALERKVLPDLPD
jgi:hypothetical protein